MSVESVTPITRRSLHDELAERLREAISAGDFKAGQKLPELDLCKRFGVSRTPMREALKVLATEGFVTLTPNRGATVASATEEELADLFPIMSVLEALGGELAAERMTEAEFQALQMKHDRMADHFRKQERGPYQRINEQIHLEIMKAARNAPLLSQWQALMVRIKRARFVAQMPMDYWRGAMQDHEDMMEALKARDGEKMSAILRRHVNYNAESVREAFRAGTY